MHTNTDANTHTHTDTHTDTHTNTHTNTHTDRHAHARTHVHMHTHAHARTHTHTHAHPHLKLPSSLSWLNTTATIGDMSVRASAVVHRKKMYRYRQLRAAPPEYPSSTLERGARGVLEGY